jgi:hypothetical protein
MLLAAFLFYKILIRLGMLLERPAEVPIGSYRLSADVVVSCWLLYPWTLGWTAWPTLMMGQLALVFFLLSMHLLLNAETKGRVVAAAFVYALCDFTYEPFYLAFLPFLVILLISDERRHFWLKVVLLFAVQVIAVGYNRLMAHIMVNGGAAKSIDFSSVFESLDRIRGLLGILCYSAPQTAKLISNSASVMVGATIASLFLLKHFGQTRIALRYSVVLVLAFGFGAAIWSCGLRLVRDRRNQPHKHCRLYLVCSFHLCVSENRPFPRNALDPSGVRCSHGTIDGRLRRGALSPE